MKIKIHRLKKNLNLKNKQKINKFPKKNPNPPEISSKEKPTSKIMIKLHKNKKELPYKIKAKSNSLLIAFLENLIRYYPKT
jgi:hypothetical protein